MSTRKPSLVLAALERTLGVDFVEQLYADFLATDAFATYTYHKSLLKGAYDAVRTAPDFATEVLSRRVMCTCHMGHSAPRWLTFNPSRTDAWPRG
jgi:hypothetical protein